MVVRGTCRRTRAVRGIPRRPGALVTVGVEEQLSVHGEEIANGGRMPHFINQGLISPAQLAACCLR